MRTRRCGSARRPPPSRAAQFDLRTPQYQSTDEQCGPIGNFDGDLYAAASPPGAAAAPSLRSPRRTVDILATPMSGEAACSVLERWEVRGIFPRMSADELASVPLTLQTFEQSVILLRLVHASLRLLPAWTLCAPALPVRRTLTPRAGSAG